MIEMLLSMVLVSTMLLLVLGTANQTNVDYYYFLNDYLYKQSKAILNLENIDVESGIYFNNLGHVNKARTIDFKNHQVIIHLGNGYATSK